MFFNWWVGCINWGVTRIMESISANLLEQLNFKRNVVRIEFFLHLGLSFNSSLGLEAMRVEKHKDYQHEVIHEQSKAG